jgi:hypothetical protein
MFFSKLGDSPEIIEPPLLPAAKCIDFKGYKPWQAAKKRK